MGNSVQGMTVAEQNTHQCGDLGQDVDRLFELLDQDRSGTLDLQELLVLFSNPGSFLNDLQLDCGDRLVTLQEWRAHFTRLADRKSSKAMAVVVRHWVSVVEKHLTQMLHTLCDPHRVRLNLAAQQLAHSQDEQTPPDTQLARQPAKVAQEAAAAAEIAQECHAGVSPTTAFTRRSLSRGAEIAQEAAAEIAQVAAAEIAQEEAAREHVPPPVGGGIRGSSASRQRQLVLAGHLGLRRAQSAVSCQSTPSDSQLRRTSCPAALRRALTVPFSAQQDPKFSEQHRSVNSRLQQDIARISDFRADAGHLGNHYRRHSSQLSSTQLPKMERFHTAQLLPEGCAAEEESAPALCSAAVIKQLRQIGALVSQIELGYKAKQKHCWRPHSSTVQVHNTVTLA